MKRRELRIGTRGSRLALWQANYVKALLKSLDAAGKVEIVVIKTSGDRILDRPLLEAGGKGLFVKEIQVALINKDVDLAIHSLKDYPAANPEELGLACVPTREDPTDALVMKRNRNKKDLPPDAMVGTGSLRRSHQLKILFPSFLVSGLRRNVETRLRSVDEGALDAVVLASAGLKRLGFADRITRRLSLDEMVPAVGQGALAIETRRDNEGLIALLSRLQDEESRLVVDMERRFLLAVGGNCTTPLGVHASIDEERVSLRAFLSSIDGNRRIKKKVVGRKEDADLLVDHLVESFMKDGAEELLGS